MNTFSFHKTSQDSLGSWVVGAFTFVICFALIIAALVAGVVTVFNTLLVSFGAVAAWCLTVAALLVVTGPAIGTAILLSSLIGGAVGTAFAWVASKFKKSEKTA